jgi:hypothetical protein
MNERENAVLWQLLVVRVASNMAATTATTTTTTTTTGVKNANHCRVTSDGGCSRLSIFSLTHHNQRTSSEAEEGATPP